MTEVQTTVQPEVNTSSAWPPGNAVASNSVLPYMLVKFEVGTSQPEVASIGSEDEMAIGDLIDLTGNSQAATSKQKGPAKRHTPKKRVADNDEQAAPAKRHVSQPSIAADRSQPSMDEAESDSGQPLTAAGTSDMKTKSML